MRLSDATKIMTGASEATKVYRGSEPVWLVGEDPANAWRPYCVSLLHFDGTDGSTIITDEIGKTWAANGHAQLDTSDKEFGSASLLCDANGDDYVSTPYSSDFAPGASDFTLDLRIKSPAFLVQGGMCGHNELSDRGWSFNVPGGSKLRFTTNGGVALDCTYAFSTNTRYHAGIFGLSGKLYMYVDGVLLNEGGTPYSEIHDCGGFFVIGRAFADYAAAEECFNGWIEEFRFLKGFADIYNLQNPPVGAYSLA